MAAGGTAVVALEGNNADIWSATCCAGGMFAGGTIAMTATNSMSGVRSSMSICAAKGSQARQPPRRPARSHKLLHSHVNTHVGLSVRRDLGRRLTRRWGRLRRQLLGRHGVGWRKLRKKLNRTSVWSRVLPAFAVSGCYCTHTCVFHDKSRTPLAACHLFM